MKVRPSSNKARRGSSRLRLIDSQAIWSDFVIDCEDVHMKYPSTSAANESFWTDTMMNRVWWKKSSKTSAGKDYVVKNTNEDERSLSRGKLASTWQEVAKFPLNCARCWTLWGSKDGWLYVREWGWLGIWKKEPAVERVQWRGKGYEMGWSGLMLRSRTWE